MIVSRTTINTGDPVIDVTGTRPIVTDCCEAIVEDYTIVQDLGDLSDDGIIYCGTGASRGRCAGRAG